MISTTPTSMLEARPIGHHEHRNGWLSPISGRKITRSLDHRDQEAGAEHERPAAPPATCRQRHHGREGEEQVGAHHHEQFADGDVDDARRLVDQHEGQMPVSA
jgi:hypothetical protein